MSDERLEQIQGMLPTAPPAEQDAARLELLDEVDLQRHVAKRRLETIRDLDQTLDRAVDIRDRSEEIPLIRVVEALSTGPARLFGIEGGSLRPGAPADLVLVDLDEPWIVREADIRSRSKNTCFEGARLQGKVLQTMVAGRTVFTA